MLHRKKTGDRKAINQLSLFTIFSKAQSRRKKLQRFTGIFKDMRLFYGDRK